MAALRPSCLTLSRNLTAHSISRSFTSSRSSFVAKLTIVGRLAAEPESVPTSNGQDMVKYAVGTSYGPPDNRQTSWWRVAYFTPDGPAKDRIMGLEKGTLVYIEGDASMRKFETKEGKTESALSIVQKKLEVLRRPDRSSEEGSE